MKTLLTAALLVSSFAVQAGGVDSGGTGSALVNPSQVITLGTAVGQGGSRTYFNVPNDSGMRVDIEINAVQNYGKVTVGALVCTGYLTGLLKCSDGGQMDPVLYEQYIRTCHAGRCNSHWQLNGGTLERP